MDNKTYSCIIISHLSLRDSLIINAIVIHLSNIYNLVYFVCNKKYYKSINQIYCENNKIKPIYIEYNMDIFKKFKDIQIFCIGKNNPNWKSLCSKLILENMPYNYFKTFYKQLDLDYDIRYKYEHIYRNKEREVNFYKKYISSQYIFINDKINIKNATTSFYYNKEQSDNILDYCSVIEAAEEIHVLYDEFFSLCVFLDLSKIKKKNIYTDISNIKDFHKSLHDWTIVSLN